MPATRYKIWQWGDADTSGTCVAYNVGLTSRAKKAEDDNPFVVANELISLRLGKILGLPMADGVVIEREGEPYFASMNFNIEGLSLPPADPSAIAEQNPRLACGVLVFDIWIVNDDRHRRNLHYEKAKNALYIFDQSHALYGQHGLSRLVQNVDNIGIGPHCLIPEISSLMYVPEWVHRLSKIPDFYIRDTIIEAVHVGVPIGDLNDYVKFLTERRGRIIELIKNNMGRFENAQQDLFFSSGELAQGALDFQI